MGRTGKNLQPQQHASSHLDDRNDRGSRSPHKKSAGDGESATGKISPCAQQNQQSNVMKNLSVESMRNNKHMNTLYSY